MIWEQVLRDESKIELHAALTPTWSETAQYADYVLPMGHGAERHDLMSQETHAAKWIGFRQPVLRVCARARRREDRVDATQANPGEVWEEDEFWIALSLAHRSRRLARHPQVLRVALPQGRAHHASTSTTAGSSRTRCRACPRRRKKQGMTPLEYMRRHGAFLVETDVYEGAHEDARREGTRGHGQSTATTRRRPRTASRRRRRRRQARAGFATPSRRLELYCQDAWPSGAGPSRRCPATSRATCTGKHSIAARASIALIPTFRLPTLIHTRSGNAKWLYELSNTNPVWIHPEDAELLGVETGDLVRVSTRIGYFVNKAWVTEGMRPGVVACSHHLGRWRLFDDRGTDSGPARKVTREELAPGQFRFRRLEDIAPVRVERSRLEARLVDRRRRAPEPDLPRAARSDQRHALLAPEA